MDILWILSGYQHGDIPATLLREGPQLQNGELSKLLVIAGTDNAYVGVALTLWIFVLDSLRHPWLGKAPLWSFVI